MGISEKPAKIVAFQVVQGHDWIYGKSDVPLTDQTKSTVVYALDGFGSLWRKAEGGEWQRYQSAA